MLIVLNELKTFYINSNHLYLWKLYLLLFLWKSFKIQSHFFPSFLYYYANAILFRFRYHFSGKTRRGSIVFHDSPFPCIRSFPYKSILPAWCQSACPSFIHCPYLGPCPCIHFAYTYLSVLVPSSILKDKTPSNVRWYSTLSFLATGKFRPFRFSLQKKKKGVFSLGGGEGGSIRSDLLFAVSFWQKRLPAIQFVLYFEKNNFIWFIK